MRTGSTSTPGSIDEQQQQHHQFMHYWSRQDDKILSPYMPGYHSPEARHYSPALSSGLASSLREDMLQPKGNLTFPEELEDDYLLMESLDLPPASVLPRSSSAHDLGEDIDPEMLPDLETLQETFEIPAQLRMDMPMSDEATQQQGDPTGETSHSQHYSQQQHQAPLRADPYHMGASQYGPEHHSGRNSGATTPSGPRSSASDESLHPSTHYTYGSRPQRGPAGSLLQEAADLSPAHLGQSRSMPLVDGFEGLTELQQQAADMLAGDVGDNLWYPMQHDKVFAQDTAAALEGLDITCTASGMPRAMSSSDLECAQAQQDWQDYDVTEQKGVDTMSTADVLAELAYLNPRNKRKGKGGRQPAMDPRLDPNVDPKKAKRILANRLSAARSKMKQKSHVEALRRRIDLLSKQKSDTKATLAAAKSSCEGKADENDTLKAQIKTLEGHIHRQAMMTTRLVEEQNSLLGITTPYELEPSSMCSDPASTSMYATYPNAKSDSRPRNLLPPPSRPAKTRDALGCLLPQPNAAGKSGQDAGHRKALAGKDVARRGGPEALQSEINPPLKTWGSTGKRQPSRPRQKA
ncbi:hypothetical protein ABBQ32_012194 [Trebouxia sp. C0010 RCD-2024]